MRVGHEQITLCRQKYHKNTTKIPQKYHKESISNLQLVVAILNYSLEISTITFKNEVDIIMMQYC